MTNEDRIKEQRFNFNNASNDSKKSFLLNFAVASLLTVAVTLHIVCMATPHMALIYRSSISSSVYSFLHHKHKDQAAMENDNGPNVQRHPVQSGIVTELDFGLFELCITTQNSDKTCIKWTGSTDLDESSGLVKSIKAPHWLLGAQGMSGLGVLVAGATDIIAVITLLLCRRSESCRLLPAFICIGALVGGTFVFLSDVMVGFKYKDILKHITSPDNISVLESVFSFSWGFALDIISVPLMWLSGLVAILDYRKTKLPCLPCLLK